MAKTNFFGALLFVLAALPLHAAEGPVFRDLQGASHTIDEFTGNGKWTVLMIWAYDCKVCNAEAHEYVDFHTFNKDKQARMLGLSIDGWARREQSRAFVDRHHVNFPTLIGEPEDVTDMVTRLTGQPWYGTPTFLIYDPQGKLRAAQAGAVPPRLISDFIAKNSPVGD